MTQASERHGRKNIKQAHHSGTTSGRTRNWWWTERRSRSGTPMPAGIAVGSGGTDVLWGRENLPISQSGQGRQIV